MQEIQEILEFLKNRGYKIERVFKKFKVNGEEFEVSEYVASFDSVKYVLVRREEDNRPLTPLERFAVALARLLGVRGFVVLSNGEELLCLRVDNGERVSIEQIPEAKEAEVKSFDFDEEKEKRIVVAMGMLRCPCKKGCRI